MYAIRSYYGPGISEAELAAFDARMANGGDGDAQWFDLFASRRVDPKVRAELGPVGTRSFGHPNIFPNLWVSITQQVCLRIPRGPFETELWWFNYLIKDAPESQRRQAIFAQNHVFGPRITSYNVCYTKLLRIVVSGNSSNLGYFFSSFNIFALGL